ncbi:hypothetical protein TNCV_1984291 [Trichonephila clavipes]|nr:hypothetical protein TNCV_1984291 [Trichonephila clavipes]
MVRKVTRDISDISEKAKQASKQWKDQTSSLDLPPCTMSRTPTRFKQHRVTTTRPMNCYAVSTRLGRSRHRFFSLSHQDVDSRS